MDIWYYLMTPFTLLLKLFCDVFNSYGWALFFFALVVKLILFPFSLKGKKSMIQMNMLSGKMQKLQKQYGKDQQRYNEEVQKLYAREGVNPMGGCLWSFIPLLILFPLYAIIRQPLKYMMGMTADQIAAVARTLNWSSVAVSSGWIKESAEFVNAGYNQLYLASLITPDKVSAVQAAAGETLKEVFSINFSFLGADLSQVPHLKFWANGMSWSAVGLFLIPVASAATGLLFSLVSMRTSKMNQNDQTDKNNLTMLLITPLMSLWIGFSMPAALSIYWIANNILGMVQEMVCGRMLKKDYARAAEMARQREIEEKEEEKRQRREKAEQRAREAEEARKSKGRKKAKAANEDKMSAEQKAASRVGIRQYARGRAYDPGRYGGVTPYHDGEATIETGAGGETREEPPEELQAPGGEPAAPVEETDRAAPGAAEAEVPAEEAPGEEDKPRED